MKAIMRLSKKQVLPDLKYSPGSATFKPALYMAAGYTTYDVFCVGGMGGYAGDSAYNSTYAHTTAGGGGGGSLRYRGLLSSLAPSVAVVVGAKGGPQGARGADGGYSVAGLKGGDSSFGNLVAYGGEGAGSCMFALSGKSLGANSPSTGGNGGGNSLGLGTIGQGGQAEWYGGVGNAVHHAAVAPTPGVYTDSGNGIGGGGGGGGGKGMFRWNSATIAAGPGADGSTGPVAQSLHGDAIGYFGGNGGGANSRTVAGWNDNYGSDGGMGNPDGVVVLHFS